MIYQVFNPKEVCIWLKDDTKVRVRIESKWHNVPKERYVDCEIYLTAAEVAAEEVEGTPLRTEDIADIATERTPCTMYGPVGMTQAEKDLDDAFQQQKGEETRAAIQEVSEANQEAVTQALAEALVLAEARLAEIRANSS